MKRLGSAHEDLGVAGDCILALFTGEEEQEGDRAVGSLLVAESLHMLRMFLKG